MSKKKRKKQKFSFYSGQLIGIVFLSMGLGILIGSILIYEKEGIHLSNSSKELDELIYTYQAISNQYYKKISKIELLDAAVEGMVSKLDDPYSLFMNQEDSQEFNEVIDGEYKGIGITVKKQESSLKAISIQDDSPAKEAGVKVGDQILEINHQFIQNKTIEEISHLIHEKNDNVFIKIKREDQEYTYDIKKKMIDNPTVSSKIYTQGGQKIGYLSISVFSSNTYQQFVSALEKLEKKKINSLIIDVRNNPGGHLDQVKDILDLFLEKKKVLYQISNNKDKKKVYAQTREKRSYDIVVLINKNSASASEILASSIKESYGGIIVGLTSYGKGSVQKQYKLSSGSSIKYTVKEWLTPKGNSIDKVGVKPNEVIEQDEKYYEDPIDENDTQLNKALELLS